MTVLLSSCASTGRGEFPPFSLQSSDKSLAILPPLGVNSKEVRNSILYHLDQNRLNKNFRSIRIVGDESAQNVFSNKSNFRQVTDSELDRLSERIQQDLMLGFIVNELRVEQFSTTETKKLERTSNRYENTNISQGNNDSDNTSITTSESRYSTREIPIKEGNIRVIVSMSAAVIDVQNQEVVWSGRRIERTQDELKHLSEIELIDIVIERVMYRVISRLTS